MSSSDAWLKTKFNEKDRVVYDGGIEQPDLQGVRGTVLKFRGTNALAHEYDVLLDGDKYKRKTSTAFLRKLSDPKFSKGSRVRTDEPHGVQTGTVVEIAPTDPERDGPDVDDDYMCLVWIDERADDSLAFDPDSVKRTSWFPESTLTDDDGR